jgi:hypothetical protein
MNDGLQQSITQQKDLHARFDADRSAHVGFVRTSVDLRRSCARFSRPAAGLCLLATVGRNWHTTLATEAVGSTYWAAHNACYGRANSKHVVELKLIIKTSILSRV